MQGTKVISMHSPHVIDQVVSMRNKKNIQMLAEYCKIQSSMCDNACLFNRCLLKSPHGHEIYADGAYTYHFHNMSSPLYTGQHPLYYYFTTTKLAKMPGVFQT